MSETSYHAQPVRAAPRLRWRDVGLENERLPCAANTDLLGALDSLSGRLSALAAEHAELAAALRESLVDEAVAGSGCEQTTADSGEASPSLDKSSTESMPLMLVESMGIFGASKYHRAGLAPGQTSAWEDCHAEAMTALDFSLWQFWKAFFYEFIPVFLACPIAVLAEGVAVARARKFWPYNPIQDILFNAGVWALLALAWFWAPDDVNIFDCFLILLLSFSRAATLGCKYATYGSSATKSIGGEEYMKFERGTHELMASSVLNIKGWQDAYLWEKVHFAGFMSDCDLSCASVRFDSLEERNMVQEAVDSHLANIESVASAQGSEMAYTDFNSIWMQDTQRWKHKRDPSRLPNQEVTGTTFALRAVFFGHSKKQAHGKLLLASLGFFGLTFGFAPAIIRSAQGLPPFGTTPEAQFLLVLQSSISSIYSFINLFYVVAPCLFFFRQYMTEVYLSASIGHNGVPKSFVGAKIPLLDLAIPSNVMAWMATWRTLHGPEFCAAFQTRANCYLVFTFGVIMAGSGLQAVAFLLNSDKNSSDILANKLTTFGYLLTVSFFVCAEILWGYGINLMSESNVASLAEQRMTITSLLDTEHDNKRRADLERSIGLLEQAELEIQSKAVARPTRIAFLKADIARVFTVLTMLAAVMYADLVRMTNLFGYDFL